MEESIWKHDRSKRCTYRLVWQGRLLGINQRDIGRENRSDSIDVYTSAGYMLRIDCWEAEKDLKTTYGSECALTSLAVDEPLEYARLYLDGNLQMWVDTEDSLELY